MTHIAISDELAARIAANAAERGCDAEELVCMLLQQALFIEEMNAHLALSPAIEERLRQSLAQLDRGEVVEQQEVEAFFEGWLQELRFR